MKILVYIGEMGKGGAERVIANLTNYLITKGEKVTIITDSSTNSAYNLSDSIKMDILDKRPAAKNSILRTIRRVHELRKIIKNENPDLNIAFLSNPSLRMLLANLFNHRKVVISVRNDPSRTFTAILDKILVKTLYLRADGFVFQTEDMKSYFNKRIQDKAVVIPNPINPDFIVEQPFKGVRKKEIVSVGRLEPQKNHKLLLDAFAIIHKKNPDYKLIIYGEGSLRRQLEAHIAELGLGNFIELPGQINDVKKAIYDSSIFVMSSDYEGMPNALMEAMALGLPCVSTDCPCGGPKFLIKNHENGLLTPCGNAEKMARVIDSILSSKKVSDVLSRGAIKITTRLSPDSVNRKWHNHLKKLMLNGIIK